MSILVDYCPQRSRIVGRVPPALFVVATVVWLYGLGLPETGRGFLEVEFGSKGRRLAQGLDGALMSGIFMMLRSLAGLPVCAMNRSNSLSTIVHVVTAN